MQERERTLLYMCVYSKCMSIDILIAIDPTVNTGSETILSATHYIIHSCGSAHAGKCCMKMNSRPLRVFCKHSYLKCKIVSTIHANIVYTYPVQSTASSRFIAVGPSIVTTSCTYVKGCDTQPINVEVLTM